MHNQIIKKTENLFSWESSAKKDPLNIKPKLDAIQRKKMRKEPSPKSFNRYITRITSSHERNGGRDEMEEELWHTEQAFIAFIDKE